MRGRRINMAGPNLCSILSARQKTLEKVDSGTGRPVGMAGIKAFALAVFLGVLVWAASVSAQTRPGEFEPLEITDDESRAELSVLVSDSTFAFGTNLLNTWLTPQSSILTNDGTAAENFLGRISGFTDGSNNWAISISANGADSIRAQWSTDSDAGPWSDVSAYDTDFTVATNVAVSDSVTFWFRIQTPLSTSSYDQHSSTLTVTAQAY
jgi:hypothetical protein